MKTIITSAIEDCDVYLGSYNLKFQPLPELIDCKFVRLSFNCLSKLLKLLPKNFTRSRSNWFWLKQILKGYSLNSGLGQERYTLLEEVSICDGFQCRWIKSNVESWDMEEQYISCDLEALVRCCFQTKAEYF